MNGRDASEQFAADCRFLAAAGFSDVNGYSGMGDDEFTRGWLNQVEQVIQSIRLAQETLDLPSSLSAANSC